MTYGTLFKTLRKELGLNQASFAKELCISQSALSKIEADKLDPNLDMFFRAARMSAKQNRQLPSSRLVYQFRRAVWRGL